MNTLSASIDGIESGLQTLSRRARAAFCAACADGLFSLYEQMEHNSGFGNSRLLRQILEASWNFAMGFDLDNPQAILVSLRDLAPHGDDIDAPSSTYAQDVVILVDCAVTCSTNESVSSACMQYAFEPLVTYATLRDHGLVAVGGSAEEESWLESLGEDSTIALAIRHCLAMIAKLQGQVAITTEVRALLVELAMSLRPPDSSPNRQSF